VTEQIGRMHNQVVELLSAYIDNEVTAEERALVEAHLLTCATCTHNLATLRQTIALLGELPQVVVPRLFTLRETDVKPARPARVPWWRRPWAEALIAATALLLCVAAVAAVLMLRRTGIVEAPASIALQAPAAPRAATAASPEQPVERSGVEEKAAVEVQAEKETERVMPAATPEVPTADIRMQQEAPAEPAAPGPEISAQKIEAQEATPAGETSEGTAYQAVETEVVARDEARTLTAGAPTRPAAAAAALPSSTPAPAPEAITASPTPVLLEVQDLSLEIQPGVIRASGRLPLPIGRELSAELWREGQPLEWAIPQSQLTRVEASGYFSLELKAKPDHPDFNLFATGPAEYEIRIHPVNPPEAIEARIPFDTYGPPTSSP
jgi:anti-sigma factor RsiW